jgi:hypothetical protein
MFLPSILFSHPRAISKPRRARFSRWCGAELKHDEGITLELRGGDVAVISISDLSSVQGTYSVDGNNVTVTMPDGDIDIFTIQDGNLTTRAFGEDTVFDRQ